MIRCSACVAFVSALAGVAAPSLADIVVARHIANGRGLSIQAFLDGQLHQVFAGQLIHELQSGTGVAAQLEGVRNLYCMEVDQFVSDINRVFNVDPLDELPLPESGPLFDARAGAVASLFKSAAGLEEADDAANEFAAAFAIAIWEMVYDYDPNVIDGNIDLSSGRFRVLRNGSPISGSTLINFNSLITEAGENISKNGVYTLSNDAAQDLIVRIPTPGSTSLLAFGGLVLTRRKR
ncbi:MAG: hypothetical protein RBS39_11120 [Phycisphaerales bacterium]|jgi:hypothetical protein|nr:hypothetical protein [Phycisphaerales bacterium]